MGCREAEEGEREGEGRESRRARGIDKSYTHEKKGNDSTNEAGNEASTC